MREKTIEAMIGSPPERDELVVQLFARDGGQWGEIYRENGFLWIDLFERANGQPLKLPLDELVEVLSVAGRN